MLLLFQVQLYEFIFSYFIVALRATKVLEKKQGIVVK